MSKVTKLKVTELRLELSYIDYASFLANDRKPRQTGIYEFP